MITTPFINQVRDLSTICLNGSLNAILRGGSGTGKTVALKAAVESINRSSPTPVAAYVPASYCEQPIRALQMLFRSILDLKPLDWVMFDEDALAKRIAAEIHARRIRLLVMDHQASFTHASLYAAWLVARFCQERGHPLGLLLSGIQLAQFSMNLDSPDVSIHFFKEEAADRQFDTEASFLTALMDVAPEICDFIKANPGVPAKKWVTRAIEATRGNIGRISNLATLTRSMSSLSFETLNEAVTWMESGLRPIPKYQWGADLFPST